MPSSHLILCRPLLLLPPIPPSIRVFSNESTLHMSTGVSASASVLPMNTQDWSPLGWTGWISLRSMGFSRVFSNTTVQKHQFFWCSAFFAVQLSHPYMTTGKTIALTKRTFVGKVMSCLCFLFFFSSFIISWRLITLPNQIWKRHVHPNVHCRTVYNSQDMEAT